MTEARHSFTFTFDEAFVTRALRRDKRWALVKVLLLYAAAVPLLRYGLGGDGPLFYGLMGGGFVATMTLALALYAKAGRSAYQLWLRQSPSRQIRYELFDDGFTIHMDHASSRFAWQGLRQLWRYPDVWLIEVIRKQSAFFPPECASSEARAFLEERCRTGGAKV